MVTFPVRVLQFLGVRTLILTAATGGIRAELRPGNIVCLADHLNLLGTNPLRGLHDERLGPRFPDMTEVYSKRLRSIARDEGKRLGINLIPGVYACLPGPSYETPAEIRMLQTLGADVVGMSTVPEAIVARQAGIDVLAFALVTNAAAGVVGTPISHHEVLEAGKKATPMLAKLIRRVVLRLSGIEPGKTGLTGDFPFWAAVLDPADQAGHIVADQVFNHLVGTRVPECLGGMRGRQSDCVHARGPGGLNADGGVLEDDRAGRLDSRPGRGDEEDLRVGLAAGDILERGDRREPAVQTAIANGQFEIRHATPLEPIASRTPRSVSASSTSRTPSMRAMLPAQCSR